MSMITIQNPFEKCLYWLLILFSSLAFSRGFDLLFYSFDGGTWQYNLIRIITGLGFLFAFVEIVNRKIITKYSQINQENKDEK